MRITIIIEDTEDGEVTVTKERVLGEGEEESVATSATSLTDALLEMMDQLGEIEGAG